MPIYEYSCRTCKRKFSVLCSLSARVENPPCEHCGKTDTLRLVSRVKTVRSEEAIMEGLADPSALSGLDENDPRTIARWAKKMAKEMGEDIGDEIESMAEEEIRKAERGEPSDEGESTACPSGTDTCSTGLPPAAGPGGLDD